MTDHPLIFSAPMIRALIEGRKTQTRRVMNPHEWYQWKFDCVVGRHARFVGGDSGDVVSHCRLPAIVGDQLWVREAWKVIGRERNGETELIFQYSADGAVYKFTEAEEFGSALAAWGKRGNANRSSIHMPRWASRITLTVKEVRVQRVQEISEADAEAEGLKPTTCANVVYEGEGFPSYKSAFGIAWNSIHGPDAWRRNDWVCALTFSVDPRNIDASIKGAA